MVARGDEDTPAGILRASNAIADDHPFVPVSTRSPSRGHRTGRGQMGGEPSKTRHPGTPVIRGRPHVDVGGLDEEDHRPEAGRPRPRRIGAARIAVERRKPKHWRSSRPPTPLEHANGEPFAAAGNDRHAEHADIPAGAPCG